MVLCLRLEQSCVDLWFLLPNFFNPHQACVWFGHSSGTLDFWAVGTNCCGTTGTPPLGCYTMLQSQLECVCVFQYCAVSMLLRTVLVLRGSQWQSRFSCFDAANPFARSGLRVLDDTHIVRILINRLSKAFRMLWLLPGKVDSAQLV